MKRLIAGLLLCMVLLTSCDALPGLPWGDDSDNSDVSSQERERKPRRDKEDEPDETGDGSDEDRGDLRDVISSIFGGGGSTAGSGSAAAGSFVSGEEDDPEGSFAIYAQLTDHFAFSSGAGAWATDLSIAPDGSFTGVYFDADMGDMGDEYPNGTEYHCEFSGQFSKAVKVDDYTYSIRLMALYQEGTPGDVSYEDGVRYICAEPYGLDGAEELLLYCPGKPVDQLPDEFKGWVLWYMPTSGVLETYGLYNVNGGQGFASYSY